MPAEGDGAGAAAMESACRAAKYKLTERPKQNMCRLLFLTHISSSGSNLKVDGVHLLEFFDIVAFVPAGEHGIGTREGVDEQYLRPCKAASKC